MQENLARTLRDIAENVREDLDGVDDEKESIYEEGMLLDLRALANIAGRLDALADEIEREHVYPHQDYNPLSYR